MGSEDHAPSQDRWTAELRRHHQTLNLDDSVKSRAQAADNSPPSIIDSTLTEHHYDNRVSADLDT